MSYVIASLLGMVGGAICIYLALEQRRLAFAIQKRLHNAKIDRARKVLQSLRSRERALQDRAAQSRAELERRIEEANIAVKQKEAGLEERRTAAQAELDRRIEEARKAIKDKEAGLEERGAAAQAELDRRIQENDKAIKLKEAELEKQTAIVQEELELQRQILRATEQTIQARVVQYDELKYENSLLKRDLLNLDVNSRKLQLDRDLQQKSQESLDAKIDDLGERYLKDNVKWISSSLNADNFIRCRERLEKVVESCRDVGLNFTPDQESELISELRRDYGVVVRAAAEREKQARIKANIREEQAREREIERERARAKQEHDEAEQERAAIEAAYEKALAQAQDEHGAEVEELRAKLEEARAHLASVEQTERAISQAQLTKTGHVYVISNIGSLGEGVFKIGVTRRLEPLDRIKELGDASVPFPFDVHMMISSENAPALESVLHRAFHKMRINKMNPRKEFFKTEIEAIHRIVKENQGEVEYVADAEALQYRQSLDMSEEDQEFIESVYDEAEDDGVTSDDTQ
jgi:hypothetical protein